AGSKSGLIQVGRSCAGTSPVVQNGPDQVSFLLFFGISPVDFALKVVQWSESETVRLQLWDIAGILKGLLKFSMFWEASACVVMFDVTNTSTFSNSQKWKQDLDSKLVLPDGSAVPCLLLANKCDLSPWAVKNGFLGWVETSVKENKNINESMRVLIEKMMSSSSGDGNSSSAGTGDYINIKETSPPGWACC
uniref:RAB29, member RAS oncogene family n=1 Tax=Zosterops lateralis melanops TaxID=1220523 RepID=A0A8D2NQ58_ZOSLA